jgi:transcriptional regulator with XRE-family HTH domain
VYHAICFVARIKQSVASKIRICYVFFVIWREECVEHIFEAPKEADFMAQSTKNLVNTLELGRAIRRKREDSGLSLRDVADETGVSASTLSRIENGTGKPDADNIARLTTWLNVPMERIMGGRQQDGDEARAVVYFPQEGTPEIVEAHLRADRSLTPETAKALSELFRVAYSQFSRPGEDKRKRRR